MMKEVAKIVEGVGAPKLCETTVADDGRINGKRACLTKMALLRIGATGNIYTDVHQ